MYTDAISEAAGLRMALRQYPRDLRDLRQSFIEDGDVHVWHAFCGTNPDLEGMSELLTSDERERMARFRFETDQQNFLFCRSMLRILIASYLGSPPAELRFAYSAHGKPSLAAPPTGLEFNLSHSAGTVLLAVCQGRRIGVDVERIRHDFKVQEIAQKFFSVAERQALEQETSVHDAFFHCWTRKEAFVKARGEGLSYPLDSFDVSVSPKREEVTLSTRPDSSEARQWRLRSLNFFPGHAAALAMECGA
jgi:4'-phosphopantetheinyl transferase